jgi:uncharacterized protein (DUF885 family)
LSTAKELEKLEEELFYGILERNPVAGTRLGLHQYDDLLPDGSLSATMEFIDFLKEYRKKFEDFSPEKLSEERALDRQVALYSIGIKLFYADEVKFWQKNPVAPNVLGNSLYLVFVKDYAPIKDRLRSITRRLEKTPDYIKETKELLTDPIKLWVEIAIDSTSYLPSLLDSILKSSKDKIPERDFIVLEKAVDDTLNSLADYEEWLSGKLKGAKEDYTLSEDEFKRLLALRKIHLTPQQILEIGQNYLDTEKKKLTVLAERFGIEANVSSVNKLLTSKGPKDFGNTLKLYKESVEDSKKFVLENDLATIPHNEKLVVMSTPDYLAHVTPFAMYFSPSKFDRTQLGIYLVTPPRSEADLGRHNEATILNTTVHEGYPGHHLQLSCANANPSLIRLMSHAPETVEGWAHYCEELMLEKGYLDDTAQLSQSVDAIWRAIRVIIDVNLSTGKMSYGEAVDTLVNEIGMSRKEAEGEIKRYTQMPTYNISYLHGKHLIKELRKKIKNKMGDDFNDRFFNDTILYSGSLPMSFFEEVFDSKIRETKV